MTHSHPVPYMKKFLKTPSGKGLDNYGDRFIMIDPQGFLRYKNSEGLILNRKSIDLDLKGSDGH